MHPPCLRAWDDPKTFWPHLQDAHRSKILKMFFSKYVPGVRGPHTVLSVSASTPALPPVMQTATNDHSQKHNSSQCTPPPPAKMSL